ncbi:protein kinase 1 [Plodia interpunctella granulovirus]|uniref:Protein kinase 1 n=1 Tax=Plodia interpunctella granulovirus TaxID=262175 RepID=A0A1L5JGV9_9BBAC|nr:protein kinase 1 [Plodia interpunctella granulovirus]APO13887.1 protein kinase 1 [Plodia interpunctella granulovirus]
MNPNKSILRSVQDLKNITIIKKLNDNDNTYENIHLCKKKGDQKIYVCKTVTRHHFNPYELVVPILMKNNPHYVKLHNFVYNEKTGESYHILDYIPDGDLFELVKSDFFEFDERSSRKLIFTLVNALNDLHKEGLIHNDVKLENLLYQRKRKRLYLCDYGLVRLIGTPGMHDGTSVYFSPEKIRKEPYNPSFDWWAVGVVAYEIMSGNYPFHDEETSEEICDIEPLDLLPLLSKPLPDTEGISERAKSFLQQMLEFDINNRLNTYDKIIKHPFLSV